MPTAPEASDTRASHTPTNSRAPFKPHPRLFFTLLVAFLLWLMFLIYLYWTTVRRAGSTGG